MKKTINRKKVLIDSLIEAIIVTIILYVIIGPYNNEFVNIMQDISKNESVLSVCILMFPIFLIVHICVNLGKTVIKGKD